MTRRLSLATVLVADYDEAIDWYTRMLGFELREDTALDGGKRWVVVAPSGGGCALLLARASDAGQQARIGDQTGGRVGFFLQTDDFANDHAALQSRGVEFLEAPRQEPYATVAVFRDLCGNRWDLLEPRR